jgi:WD40 repeat protein
VLEFPSLTPLDHFTPSPELVGSAAFLSDGKHFLTGHFSGNIHVWDIALGKVVATLQEHKDWVTVMSMAPDNQTFITASGDGSLVIWDAVTWQPLARLQGHLGGIMGMAISPTGKLVASGAGDGTIKLWDTSTRHRPMQLDGTHYALGFSKDSKTLIAETSRGAVLWDITTGHAREIPISGVEAMDLFWLSYVAVQGDRMFWLSPSGNGDVRLWDLLNNEQVAIWGAFESRVRIAAFSADGRLVATGTQDGHVKIWDVATQEEVSELLLENKVLTSLAFSPSGRHLAISGEDRYVLVWDIEEKHMLPKLNATDGIETEIISLAFSPDGRFLAAADMGSHSVRLWEMPSGEVHADLKGHLSAVMQVAFTPDGKTLAAGIQTGQVRLWNIATKQEVATLSLEGHFLSMAFSPDGRNLAVGYGDYVKERHIRLWQVPSFEEIKKAEESTPGEPS